MWQDYVPRPAAHDRRGVDGAERAVFDPQTNFVRGDPEQAGNASRTADAAVVASALIDTLSAHLDAEGKAKPGAVDAVLDQVRGLAAAVRKP